MASQKRGDSRKRLLKTPATVYLEPGPSAELAALVKRTRVPKTTYLREGIDMMLAKYRAKKA